MNEEKIERTVEATPHKELIEQILDSRVPKNEREWAAGREIASLASLLEKEEQAHVMSRYDLNMKIAEVEIALEKEKEALNGLKNVYGRGIIEEMKRVKEWTEKIPYTAYNDALREGLDHDDAWGCFVNELAEYIKKLIREEK